MTVAKRVAAEVGCELGHVVGYSVRFDDRTSKRYAKPGLVLLVSSRLVLSCLVPIERETKQRGVSVVRWKGGFHFDRPGGVELLFFFSSLVAQKGRFSWPGPAARAFFC